MIGRVDTIDLTISTWSETSTSGETAGATTYYKEYVVAFPEPVGPPGFRAEWRTWLNWLLVRLFIEKGSDRIRRVGNWALSADDFDDLEAWLTTPLRSRLTTSVSGSDRIAVIEAMKRAGPVAAAAVPRTKRPVQSPRRVRRESRFVARLSLGAWAMSARELKFTSTARLPRGKVVAHARGVAAVAEALSN